jgi:hypothetical protein
MFYFFVGGLPLLLLKHDNPTDSRFVRDFFNVHYLVLMSLAAMGTLVIAVSGDRRLAIAIVCMVVVGFLARTIFVSRMDRLRDNMNASDKIAIRKFRRLQVAAIVLNVFLFGALAAIGAPSIEAILLS